VRQTTPEDLSDVLCALDYFRIASADHFRTAVGPDSASAATVTFVNDGSVTLDAACVQNAVFRCACTWSSCLFFSQLAANEKVTGGAQGVSGKIANLHMALIKALQLFQI
jgi:hypothetical protein